MQNADIKIVWGASRSSKVIASITILQSTWLPIWL